MKAVIQLLIRLAKLWGRRFPAWKSIQNDQRGVTVALVAVMLVATLSLFAFFLNIGGALFARQRLQTMAEFGAAGGGRVVAEKIADLAEENVKNGIFPSPAKIEDTNAPEKFITAEQRSYLQTDNNFKIEVERGVKYYVEKNTPFALVGFDPDDSKFIEIKYPEKENDCSGEDKDVSITVSTYYTYPYLMENLSKSIVGRDGVELSAEATYSVRICP